MSDQVPEAHDSTPATEAVGSLVGRGVRAPTGPSVRRIVRANRLCEELGHGDDTLAALQHMKRMERALKVLHTWAAFPPLDVRHVRKLCAEALKQHEAA